MEIGNDPDFNNTHGEALFEYYVRIEGEGVTRSVAQKELALWIHMEALKLGKTKPAGEAGTYAKRLIDEGYGTVHARIGRAGRRGPGGGQDAKRGCKTPNGMGVSKVHTIRGRRFEFFEKCRMFWECQNLLARVERYKDVRSIHYVENPLAAGRGPESEPLPKPKHTSCIEQGCTQTNCHIP